jgi:hypothetical protein
MTCESLDDLDAKNRIREEEEVERSEDSLLDLLPVAQMLCQRFFD